MTHEDLKRFGAFLRSQRKEQGLCQLDVADMLGIDPATLYRLETGRHRLVRSKLYAISAAYRVRIEILAEKCGFPPASFPPLPGFVSEAQAFSTEDLAYLFGHSRTVSLLSLGEMLALLRVRSVLVAQTQSA